MSGEEISFVMSPLSSSSSLSPPLSLSVSRVPYLALARTFELIEEESKRLKIISILTNLFRSVFLLSPEEMVACVYLCLNKVLLLLLLLLLLLFTSVVYPSLLQPTKA